MLIALRGAPGFDVPRQILQRYARELQSRLRSHSGTDVVEIDGEVAEEILVRVDSAKAAAAGQTVNTIAAALRQYDTKASAGILANDHSRMQVEIAGDLDSADRVARVPIGVGNRAQVLRVGELAQVERVVRKPDTEKVLRGGQEQLVVAVRMLHTERISRWQGRVVAELEAFGNSLPGNVEAEIIFDQLEYTDERMQHLIGNISIGFALILIILLVTLGWRSALLVAAALPLMMLFTFFLMNVTGVPINQMSVTGLVVALGITVDNAIVIVDDVGQRLRANQSRLQAVRGAVDHLWLPLFGSTATTILAFMPVILQGGPSGEFVGSLAICVIYSLIGSYLISFTLVAAVAAKVIQPLGEGGWLQRGINIPALTERFSHMLRQSLRRPKTALALVMILPALGFYGITTVPEQFFPPVDRDMFTIDVSLPTRVSFEQTESVVREIDTVLAQTAGIESVDWFVGKSAAPFYYNLIERKFGAQNYAQAMVVTQSAAHSERLVDSLQLVLPPQFSSARIVVRKLEQGPPVDQPVEVRIFGPDLAILEQLGEELRLMLSTLPSVTHTSASLGESIPTVSFQMREEVLAGTAFSPMAAANNLRASLDGLIVGSLLEGTEEVPVRVRLDAGERETPDDLRSLNVIYSRAEDGYSATSLQAIADMHIRPSIVSIPHHNGQRVNSVGAQLRIGVLPDAVATDLQALMDTQHYELPPGKSVV